MVSPFISMKYIVSALAMVLKKSYIELEIQAEIMLETYSKRKNIFGVIYGYIFDAIAKYKLYGLEIATKSFLKAIELAEKDNIIMCFVELSPHIFPIIKKLEKDDEYVRRLLPRCEEFNKIYMKDHMENNHIELTPRELQVIKLVDEGYKQSEISEKLHIALITVKKHIASVYSKLNVKIKTMAINILKEKGII